MTTATKLKIAAISRINSPHHLDHLLPLCDLFQAPLVTCEESDIGLIKTFYPSCQVQWVNSTKLHTEFIKEHYDIIIHSFSWPKKIIDFELIPGKQTNRKKIRSLHIPHGNSDKGYASGVLGNYVYQDICLLYGDHMLDMLRYHDILKDLKNTVIVGNLRLAYYQKYQPFFDAMAEKKIFSRLDPKKKTILYAPTWDDYEKSTSIFDVYPFVLEQIPREYNLIVKLHPWMLRFESIGKVYHILGKHEDIPNLVFISEYPPIYPLLAKADIYLGDFSSIGYDFLAFNRSMFFFNSSNRPSSDKSLFLHQCGTTISLQEGDQILSLLEKGLRNDSHFASIRKNIYHYAFGPPCDLQKIKKEILGLCQKS